ncbi:MAG: WbqC family protein [Flavobacteriaceae bacterium]
MVVGVCPAYLPNIYYMAWMVSQKKVFLITDNPYQKQTFRNRTEIYGANGKLKLTIPIIHTKTQRRQLDNSVAIQYDNSWQKDHWKSLEAAYRSSPFFEFYEDEFYPFYHQKFEKLMDFNINLIKKILSILGAFVSLHKNEKTINEFTDLIIAKHNFKRENPHYQQVFQYKHGFINNLSVLDLLFNLGPQSLEYLEQVKTDFISTRVMQK